MPTFSEPQNGHGRSLTPHSLCTWRGGITRSVHGFAIVGPPLAINLEWAALRIEPSLALARSASAISADVGPNGVLLFARALAINADATAFCCGDISALHGFCVVVHSSNN